MLLEHPSACGLCPCLQDCDSALLRRFSRRIQVPLPNQQERQCFFQAMLSRPEIGADLHQQDIEQLAEQTSGYSGSDLAAVCRLAAMAPVKELFQQQRQQQRQQQQGQKRRRVGSSATCSHEEALRSSQPGDARLAALAVSAAEAASAALGECCQQPGGDAVLGERLQLRRLLLADFQTALAKVQPASVDAQ